MSEGMALFQVDLVRGYYIASARYTDLLSALRDNC